MKKIFVILISIILASGFFYFFDSFGKVSITQAGSGDNVSGWAWSENIGWISFNSTNQGGATNYGVKVDKNGNISGWAWSENIGWISFNEGSGCPTAPCAPKLDKITGAVSGWARACAGTVNGDCTGDSRSDGWDGWIHLRNDSDNDGLVNTDNNGDYGVFVLGCDWDGWAWGSDVVGWIHFRGTNYGVSGTGEACASANYPPSASNLSVDPNYCLSTIYLSWNFNDPDVSDSQSAYQIQVDDSSDFSSPVVNTGKTDSPSSQTTVDLGQLSFNTTYYWRVKVWDQKGAESNWETGDSFTTPKHAYPSVNFSWEPKTPRQGQKVRFFDKSIVSSGANIRTRAWRFQNGDPATSSEQNPLVKFNTSGDNQVTLKITDTDNYSCFLQQKISVKLPPPGWQEIPPPF